MIKLSIITINLNNAIGLKKTMESIVAQTSGNFEYIIIDGGSTDGSVEIIKSFTNIQPGIYIPTQLQHQPISYWISKPDTGIYNAMNKGIKISKGQYCQFLNSGDWLAKSDVIEKMLKNMPECSILYGNMLKHLPDDKVLYNKQIPINSLLTFYMGSLNHSSTFIKRSLFEKYGFYDENLKIVSDWKFYLLVIGLNNESVAYRDIDVTCFDMKGISNTNLELDKKERRKVLVELIPSNILADYDKYASNIMQMKRINRYGITRRLVSLAERILFKIEKRETNKKGEHLFY